MSCVLLVKDAGNSLYVASEIQATLSAVRRAIVIQETWYRECESWFLKRFPSEKVEIKLLPTKEYTTKFEAVERVIAEDTELDVFKKLVASIKESLNSN